MKIDLDQKIKLIEPILIRDQRGEITETREYYNDNRGGDLTLAQVTSRSLAEAPPAANQQLAADEKIRRFKLALELIEGGTQDISTQDAAMLQKCINAIYPQIAVVAQAHAMLEGD